MRNKIVAFAILIFLLPAVKLSGQKNINSPYSRFNLGMLNRPGTFRSLAMGGISISARDNNTITFTNPASYTSFDTSSFVFDMGMDLSSLTIKDPKNSYSTTDMNFRHILMGFPLSKKICVAAGVIPYSNGYYYISEIITKDNLRWDPIIGDYTSMHKGSGSVATFFAGTGIDITKNISAGLNFNLLFGSLERLNQFELAEYQTSFHQSTKENFNISGFNFDYGIQYTKNIKKDYLLTSGVSFTSSKYYKSDFKILKERYSAYIYPPFSPDTLSYYDSNSKDSTRLPATLRFGISIGKKDKFVAGFDFVYTNWSDALIHGGTAEMTNTYTYMLGVEYIPDKFSNTSFLRRIEYRLGTHLSNDYLVLNGVNIKEYGISGGFAVRLQNSLSKATFFFDYTNRKGDISRGIHDENIFSAGVSLNLYDFWFIKRKYE